MSFQHGDVVMFPFEGLFFKGHYVGSFVDVRGKQKFVVQTSETQIFSVNHMIVEKYDPLSKKLIGVTLREAKFLPPVVSSKY